MLHRKLPPPRCATALCDGLCSGLQIDSQELYDEHSGSQASRLFVAARPYRLVEGARSQVDRRLSKQASYASGRSREEAPAAGFRLIMSRRPAASRSSSLIFISGTIKIASTPAEN